MPQAQAAAAPARKRNRKRKRRAASSSSSSSSSEDESPQVTTRPAPAPTRVVVQADSSDSDSDSSTSSSSSSSSSGSDSGGSTKLISEPAAATTIKPKRRRESRSPSPPSTAIPSFLPAPGTEGAQKREEELRTRFRKFWMESIADGFRDDLEELHKEPNLSESRLGLLIDSLASGADVFMAGPSGGANRGSESATGANEMEIVLNETS